MWMKRFLIFLPLALILLLAQSFFWVPSYDKQSLGNPDRLLKYIEGEGGDAEILNPILSADSASSTINEKVFEGLLDLDDQLRFRPRLARKWNLYEEAYLVLNPDYKKSGLESRSPDSWISWLQRELADRKAWWANIESVEIVPSSNINKEISLPKSGADGKPVQKNGRPEMEAIGYNLHQPPLLKFTLKKVDQNFFDPIHELLGKEYLERFPFGRYIRASDPKNQGRLKPHFRELLQVMEHNPVIVFDLRQGVRFHDGHEFDSGDVLFTYEAIMNPANASPRTSDFEPIKSAHLLGPHKIKFVYKRLFSPAVNAWAMGILPEHLLNREILDHEAREKGSTGEEVDKFTVRDSAFNRHPIGTGPFIFKDWEGDVQIRLERNDDYWEGPPEYREYIMRIIPDTLTQEMEFYSGAADNYSVLPHQVARLKSDPKYQNFSTVGRSYSYIGYNLRNPLFADPRVRRALGMAIDVDKIIKFVLYGEGERVTGPFAKITDWYDPTVKPLPYDPQGALELLNQAGWKKNEDGLLEKNGKLFEFNLITNSGNPLRKSILTIVQDHWKKLGIRCNTQLFEWAVFLKDFVNKQKFDALVLGWSTGIDPDQYQLWHSSQTGPHQLNFVGYKNSEADDLIIAIRQEYDRDRQIELSRKFHRLIARDQPYTFLFVRKATRLLDKKIVIVERDDEGKERYRKIYPIKGGEISYYFNNWRKLPTLPVFSAG